MLCGRCGVPLHLDPKGSSLPTVTMPRTGTGLAAGKVIAGKYRILGEAGRGGMGQVFKADDIPLQRTVAIKFPAPGLMADPEHRSRFLREARTASALNDPRICIIHEIGEDAGRPFIAMEFVAGRSIKGILQAGPIGVEEIGRIGLEIAEALQHAHDHGIIHRDLKTANVMITADRNIKILDFGLAKRLEMGKDPNATGTRASITEAGTVLGTVSYYPTGGSMPGLLPGFRQGIHPAEN
jgi:serine/threonine protein kinase